MAVSSRRRASCSRSRSVAIGGRCAWPSRARRLDPWVTARSAEHEQGPRMVLETLQRHHEAEVEARQGDASGLVTQLLKTRFKRGTYVPRVGVSDHQNWSPGFKRGRGGQQTSEVTAPAPPQHGEVRRRQPIWSGWVSSAYGASDPFRLPPTLAQRRRPPCALAPELPPAARWQPRTRSSYPAQRRRGKATRIGRRQTSGFIFRRYTTSADVFRRDIVSMHGNEPSSG